MDSEVTEMMELASKVYIKRAIQMLLGVFKEKYEHNEEMNGRYEKE